MVDAGTKVTVWPGSLFSQPADQTEGLLSLVGVPTATRMFRWRAAPTASTTNPVFPAPAGAETTTPPVRARAQQKILYRVIGNQPCSLDNFSIVWTIRTLRHLHHLLRWALAVLRPRQDDATMVPP